MEKGGVQIMKTLLDANVCLRYLLYDIEDQALAATKFIEDGAEVTLEVLAECVYVLDGVYGVGKAEISETLRNFLDEVFCSRMAVAKCAFIYFAMLKLDFVDCILLAEWSVNDREIATFDKELKKKLLSLHFKRAVELDNEQAEEDNK